MFVQRSADRHRLQHSPWYLLPWPCPQCTNTQPHSSHPKSQPHQSGVHTTFLPFWVPTSRSGQAAAGVGGVPLPRSSLGHTCSGQKQGLHLLGGSSDKSHIVQSHTKQSVAGCTTRIAQQQKDSSHDLISPTPSSVILQNFCQGGNSLWAEGMEGVRERKSKNLFKSLDPCN